MSAANPLWGAPRIHGELLKLGLTVSQTTVAKYMVRRQDPPSQTWRTFLANHAHQLIAADFFVVPTATCRLLFVLVLLAHDRRRVVHVAVTEHPTAAWTVQQFRDAFPWDELPRYLLRDRDHAFDHVKTIGIQEVLTAPGSPWQNAYVERFIGSVRRECLDHVIVLTAAGFRRVLNEYVAYYSRTRTHLGLNKDAPVPRPSHAADGWARDRHPAGRRACTTATSAAPRSLVSSLPPCTVAGEPNLWYTHLRLGGLNRSHSLCDSRRGASNASPDRVASSF